MFIVYLFSPPLQLCDSDSNSSSSDGSRARSVQSSATHAPPQSAMVLDSDEPRRSFGIKVQNLPVRSTGTVWAIYAFLYVQLSPKTRNTCMFDSEVNKAFLVVSWLRC